MLRRHRTQLRGLTTILIVLIVWEIATRTVITNQLILVPPSAIFQTLGEMIKDGTLWKNAQVSLIEFVLGYGLAILSGVVIGVLTGSSRALREFLDPLFSLLYSTPIIALSPLFIMWFKIGIASKVAVIFLYSVFPVIINTSTGIRATDKVWLEVGRSFSASRFQLFTKISVFAALPYMIAGIRLAAARAVVGVVVAELFGASAGLGLLILEAGQNFDTATLFAAVLVLATSGLVLVESLKWLERRVAPWRTSLEERE